MDFLKTVWEWLLVPVNVGAATFVLVVLGLLGRFLIKLFTASEKTAETTEGIPRDIYDDIRKYSDAEKAELQRRLDNEVVAHAESAARSAEIISDLTRSANETPELAARGEAAMKNEDFAEAAEIFDQLIAKNELAVQATARHHYSRGLVAEEVVDWHAAATHFARAAELDGSFIRLDKATRFAWRVGDYAKAKTFGERLIPSAIAKYGKNTEEHAEALNDLALVLAELGQIVRAGKLYSQALDIIRATVGKEHPFYATGLNNLAVVLKAQGDYIGAEKLYRQAMKIDLVTIGDEHPDYANRLNNLAGVLQEQGEFSSAVGYYRQAIVILTDKLGEGHPYTKAGKSNLHIFQIKWAKNGGPPVSD